MSTRFTPFADRPVYSEDSDFCPAKRPGSPEATRPIPRYPPYQPSRLGRAPRSRRQSVLGRSQGVGGAFRCRGCVDRDRHVHVRRPSGRLEEFVDVLPLRMPFDTGLEPGCSPSNPRYAKASIAESTSSLSSGPSSSKTFSRSVGSNNWPKSRKSLSPLPTRSRIAWRRLASVCGWAYSFSPQRYSRSVGERIPSVDPPA